MRANYTRDKPLIPLIGIILRIDRELKQHYQSNKVALLSIKIKRWNVTRRNYSIACVGLFALLSTAVEIPKIARVTKRRIVPRRVTSTFRSRGRRARQRTGISGRCIIEQDIHRRRPTSAWSRTTALLRDRFTANPGRDLVRDFRTHLSRSKCPSKSIKSQFLIRRVIIIIFLYDSWKLYLAVSFDFVIIWCIISDRKILGEIFGIFRISDFYVWKIFFP